MEWEIQGIMKAYFRDRKEPTVNSDICAENLRDKLEFVEESKNKYAKQRKQYHIWKPGDKKEDDVLEELKSVWLEQKTRKEMAETSYKARYWLSQTMLKF